MLSDDHFLSVLKFPTFQILSDIYSQRLGGINRILPILQMRKLRPRVCSLEEGRVAQVPAHAVLLGTHSYLQTLSFHLLESCSNVAIMRTRPQITTC